MNEKTRVAWLRDRFKVRDWATTTDAQTLRRLPERVETKPEATPRIDMPGWVYWMEPDCDLGRLKVGWSADVYRRRKELQRGPFYRMRLVARFPGTKADEEVAHCQLREWLIPGKRDWFVATVESRRVVERVFDALRPRL